MSQEPYKVGQLVVFRYSRSKTVKSKVVQIVKVNQHAYGSTVSQVYYTYDVKFLDGRVVQENDRQLISFEKHHKLAEDKLMRTHKIARNQEIKVLASHKLEKDAKKQFRV